MIVASRPLRFLVLAVGGWVGVRAYLLWPGGDPVRALTQAIAPPVAAEEAPGLSPSIAPKPSILALRPPSVGSPKPEAARRFLAVRSPAAPSAPEFGTTGEVPDRSSSGFLPPVPESAAAPLPGSPLAAPAAASRLGGSAWLIVRGGGGATPFVPQLGGSQAGMRLTYALDEARRLSLAGRVSTALGSRQREAAIGLDWQPTRLPIHVVAEQRIAIEQARGGPALGLVAGLPPTKLAAGFLLDGYGQAGVIARDGGEGYADGSLRLARPVAAIGRSRLELGLGAWGAAQRGAARLDVGPVASLVLPLGTRAVRISAEWQARVAGNARPASGPALGIGTDF